MGKHLPRYDYEESGRDYIVIDRNAPTAERIVARTILRQVAELLVDVLTLKDMTNEQA